MKISLRTENQSARQFPLSLVLACALAFGAWAGEAVPARESRQLKKPPETTTLGERTSRTNKATLKLPLAGIRAVGDWAVDPAETRQLNDLFAQARAASASLQPGPDAPARRRAIEIELNSELESLPVVFSWKPMA